VSSYQQTHHGEEAEHPNMNLNMLVDTSLRHALPEMHHLHRHHTTDHSVPTSQSGTSKEDNDVEAPSLPNQGLGFHLGIEGKVGKGYLNIPSRRRTVNFVDAEVAGWQSTKGFPWDPSPAPRTGPD
jgi:hypothetical protein